MENINALEYAKMGADTLMSKFTPETLPPEKRFHYHQGVFLAGVERVYKLTGDEKYRDYIKAWVDLHIDAEGNAPYCLLGEFDDIQPGILLFDLYKTTGDKRYKIHLDRMYDAVKKWPTNAKGGVWHKYYNPNQMWLDTMYMMGVFAAMYARTFDDGYMFEKIYTQMKLMRTYMTDEKSGLMYHMWDDSKAVPETDENGLIRRCWGRAIGWYVAAIPEIMEYMADNHPLWQEFAETERELLTSLVKYQDKKSGLWYQLVDKTEDRRNWTESSCTALFTYGMAKALRLGIIDDTFRESIIKGYNGVLSKTEVRDGKFILKDICVGTGYGDDEYYLTRPTSENDLHGIGAFLLMCTEIYSLFRKN